MCGHLVEDVIAPLGAEEAGSREAHEQVAQPGGMQDTGVVGRGE